MDFLEISWKRKSIRSFKPDDVPHDKIMKLLEAARSAPSAGNCQPWHFYVIKDEAIKQQICELSYKQKFMLSAPIHIVVCADFEKTVGRYADRGTNLYSIQDTAAAIQNLLLCAVDEGLATCWCGAFDENAMSDVLGLNENMRPVAIITLGYAAKESAKTSRRPIEEISTFIGF